VVPSAVGTSSTDDHISGTSISSSTQGHSQQGGGDGGAKGGAGDGDDGENDFWNSKSGGEEEEEETVGNTAGITMGKVLSNVLDSKVDCYDVECGDIINKYKPFINDNDINTGKKKKFFRLSPNPSVDLFSYIYHHALLNLRSKRGWLGHCRLFTKKPGAEGNGYILWEVWETRCDRPRVDAIVIRNDGEVIKIINVEKWLIMNDLSSDVQTDFDEGFCEG